MKNNVGQLIKALRMASGISQMKFAEELDLSYQQVQKYENGKAKITVARLMQISEALGIPTHIFFGPQGDQEDSGEEAEQLGLSADEVTLLMLFRRIRDKDLRNEFIHMLENVQDSS